MKRVFLLIFFLQVFTTSMLEAQEHKLLKEYASGKYIPESIKISNQSFELAEDDDNDNYFEFNVFGWDDVGAAKFPEESSPGVHSQDLGTSSQFGVHTMPHDGGVFLSLVTRDNKTYEAIGTELETSLSVDNNYVFSFFSATSAILFSPYSMMKSSKSFVNPTTIVISFISSEGEEFEVYRMKKTVDLEWKENLVLFKAPCTCSYMVVSLDFAEDQPSNSHLLLDDFSEIHQVVIEE